MTQIYGHRGAKGEAPENTLVSFQKCLEHGVRRCELDLHLSRDGELMVIHDPTLKRTTGQRGKVVEHDAGELLRYDARQGGPGWPQPCRIPKLAELFEKCPFEHWQLEVKSASRDRAARTVLAIQELVNKGLLVRKRGVGTQVVRSQFSRDERLTSLNADLVQAGKVPSTQLLEFSVGPLDAEVASALDSTDITEQEFIRVRRLRLADG